MDEDVRKAVNDLARMVVIAKDTDFVDFGQLHDGGELLLEWGEEGEEVDGVTFILRPDRQVPQGLVEGSIPADVVMTHDDEEYIIEAILIGSAVSPDTDIIEREKDKSLNIVVLPGKIYLGLSVYFAEIRSPEVVNFETVYLGERGSDTPFNALLKLTPPIKNLLYTPRPLDVTFFNDRLPTDAS